MPFTEKVLVLSTDKSSLMETNSQ